MRLSISGRPMGAGVNQNLLRDASNFMTEILMVEDLGRRSQISIEICLKSGYKDEYGQIAECNYLDDRLRPDKFYIDLDADLGMKSILITLGHELVHIKQMAFCERQESLDGLSMRWLGRLILPNELDYYDLPWEIEAHGREFGLYDRYINREKESDLLPATIIDEARRFTLLQVA
jgi:hypothetical protein